MPKNVYQKYLVKVPDREVGITHDIKGRQNPTMTYLSNKLVPGSNTYIEIGWIYEMPSPNPHIERHSHDYPEIIIHLGNDPDKPEALGAVIEVGMGDETLVVDETSCIYVPKGVPHGPLVWKKVDRPHIEMVIMPGAGTVEESNPAGSSTAEQTKKPKSN